MRSRWGYHSRDTPRTDPDERSLAHPVLISDDWRQSVLQDRDGAPAVKGAIARLAPSCGSTSSDVAGFDDAESATTAPAAVPEGWLSYRGSLYRVVVEVTPHDRFEPTPVFGTGSCMRWRSSCLRLRSLDRMRLRIVLRRTVKRLTCSSH